MSTFNYTVDTQPMAQEIGKVSNHVDATSAAVVTMQTAVIAAEQEAADHVCANVNYGFYTLMHSQISQKIAQLTSTVESKLLEMGQQAAALRNIQKRMERDYNMISNRYVKLFGSINASLQMQVYELDKPAMNLVNRDMKLSESRVKGALAGASVHQSESLKLSQQLVVSKTKGDSEQTIGRIHGYIAGVTRQNRLAEEVMRNRRIETTEEVYLPVIVTSKTSELSADAVDVHTPRSGNAAIDAAILSAVRDDAFHAVHEMEWVPRSERERKAVEAEFATLVAGWNASDRVKRLALELFGKSALQRFKEERV